MTSAKFPRILTPSLPLSELVIFANTPLLLETSYLGSTPPPAFRILLVQKKDLLHCTEFKSI